MFKKMWNAIKKFFGSVPAWTLKVNNVITAISPLVQTILILSTGFENALLAQKIINEVQGDLALLRQIVTDAQNGQPTTIESVNNLLNSILNHLQPLKTAARVKNVETQQKVDMAIQLIVEDVRGLLVTLPQEFGKK